MLRVLQAAAPGDPTAGERVRVDRGSSLTHLGLRTPDRRRLVKQGFSFTSGSETEVLEAWDAVWRASPVADVLFAALDDYRDRLPKHVPDGFWATASQWITRIDNWAHADDLARLYSWALADDRGGVYPQLEAWNAASGEWERRVSMVSLVHYSGKNSFFMPTELVFPLLENCLDDARPSVQKALGWVLREACDAHPTATVAFMIEHIDEIRASTLRRATSHLPTSEQQRLREVAGQTPRQTRG